MKQIRVWFDQYLLLEDTLTILRNSDGVRMFHFIGSHSNPIQLASTQYDERYLIERVDDDTYLTQSLKFCKEKNVHVFSPRYHQEHIQRNKHLFEEIGVGLMIPADADMMEIAKDKAKTFEFLLDNGFPNIPDYVIAHTVQQFEEAVRVIESKNRKVCMKPTDKEGGRGFWILEDKVVPSLEWLFDKSPSSQNIEKETILSVLKKEKNFEPLMVMEFLEGTEYSVDCVAEKGELKGAVVRVKPSKSYVRKIVKNEELNRLSEVITRHFQFNGVFNLQFISRKGEDKPLLLEINPRFSGGVALSALSGYNLPLGAINLALNGHTGDIGSIQTGITIQQIKHGVKLDFAFSEWK